MTKKVNFTCINDFIFPANPPVLAHSSPISQKVLLFIRIFAALHLTGVYMYDFTILKALLDKFLLLTNVAYFVSWLYFVTVVQSRFMPIFKGLDKYAEVLFQVSFCTQWIITVGYWGYLRPTLSTGFTLDFFWSLNAHGIVLFLLMLDFVFNSYRFVFPQFVFFLLVCGAYLLLINLPYSVQVKPVYGIAMNWKSWFTYVFILAGFLGALLAHFIGRKIYKSCKLPHLTQQIQQQTRQKSNSQQNEVISTNIEAVSGQNVNAQGNSNLNLNNYNLSINPHIQQQQRQNSQFSVRANNQNLDGVGHTQVGVILQDKINVIHVRPKQYETPRKNSTKEIKSPVKNTKSLKKSQYKSLRKINQKEQRVQQQPDNND